MAIEYFKQQMLAEGWYCFPQFIPHSLVERMRDDLEYTYQYCRGLQIKNGLDKTEGTAHHLLGQRRSFLECLSEYKKLDKYFTAYFGSKYILNSFGGNILTKGMSYANEIHRDIRAFSDTLPLMLNTIVFLDDFTENNGATWLMRGGHEWKHKPTETTFNDFKFQITGAAGTIYVWNSNLWHRAGENKTDKPRRSVTPELTVPFIKPGFDYTQFVNEDTPEYLKQLLGWYSRVPSTLQEWYGKDRFYRKNQDESVPA